MNGTQEYSFLSEQQQPRQAGKLVRERQNARVTDAVLGMRLVAGVYYTRTHTQSGRQPVSFTASQIGRSTKTYPSTK